MLDQDFKLPKAGEPVGEPSDDGPPAVAAECH
jgi:hypothetical protein